MTLINPTNTNATLAVKDGVCESNNESKAVAYSAKGTWTAMEHATQHDFDIVMAWEDDYNAGLVERLLDQLHKMDESWTPYPINRFQHSLQSATRAYRDGAAEELVVAALLHDIGDVIAPYNHSEVAAAILKPYVSDKTYWIVKHHGIFQGYYYNHYLGGDPLAREKYQDHPFYEDCKYFCHTYDQNAFDANYDSEPLSFFEPMLRRLFSNINGHLELQETQEKGT